MSKRKMKYEKPVLINFSAELSPMWATGWCGTGGSPTGKCQPNGVAAFGGKCQNGTWAGGQCNGGNWPF